MCPFFAWMPVEQICKTFKKTTQFIRMYSSIYLKKRHHSANSAANIYRCWEDDATDTNILDTPAVDGGKKAAQHSVGLWTEK